MITKRDQSIQRFIEDFRIVSSRQVHDVFFSTTTLRRCQQRLTILTEKFNRLKRYRDNFYSDYIYYIDRKPTKEIEHMMLRVDAYIKLSKDYTLCEFIPEYTFGDLVADAYFEVWKNGYVYGFFLEIQLSSYFRQEKYEKAYQSGKWTERWSEFPSVVIVTDHKLGFKPSQIEYRLYGKDSPRIDLGLS